ncbi:MAG: hypothetical protein JWQ98_1288 [Chlorobi bacterium]|nr:hypothetical protein [Chlorobiota bacterium]
MAASSDLFDLIKSLSKSEKRYFRISASATAGAGTNKYMHLFDLIDAREQYDEKAVRAAFAEQFTGRHFSEAKYYLYNAILRSLHLYAADRSIDVQITTMLHQAKILFARSLFRQCDKMIAKARDMAVEHERWHLAVSAQRLEHELLTRQGAGAQETIEQLLLETARYADAWRSEVEHWTIYIRLLTRIRMVGAPRNREQLAAFRDQLTADPGRAVLPPASPSAEIYHLFSIAIYREAGGDFRGALASYRSMLPIIRSSPIWLRSRHVGLSPVLYNICLLAIKARDVDCFTEHYPLLIELTETSPESPHYESRILALALLPDLHANMGDFSAALAASAELERAMSAAVEKPDILRETYLHLLLLSIHFGLGDYSRCIDYLTLVLAARPNDLSPEKYRLARAYQLILHFERGDDDLLGYLLRSAHRYFIANRGGYGSEEAIISFIRKTLRSRTGGTPPDLFRELLEAIAPLRDDPFESVFLHGIDLIAWLESKVHHRSYAEIVREQFLAEAASP